MAPRTPRTAWEFFEKSANAFPEQRIVLATDDPHGDASITYAEALREAERLGSALSDPDRLNLPKGAQVVIHLPSIPQEFVATMAVRREGLVDVPLDPSLTKPDEIRKELSKVNPACLIVPDYLAGIYFNLRNAWEEFPPIIVVRLSDYHPWWKRPFVIPKLKRAGRYAKVSKYERNVFFLKHLARDKQSLQPPRAVEPNELSTLIYGSGTSGDQKVIMWTHGNLSSNIEMASKYLTYPSDDPRTLKIGLERILLALPLSHSFGATVMNLAAAIGAEVIFVPKPVKQKVENEAPVVDENGKPVMVFDPAVLVDIMNRYHPTVVPLAPKLYRRILQYLKDNPDVHRDFSFVKMFISGSAALDTRLAEEWKKITNSEIFEGFGLTETCAASHVNHPTLNTPGTVGRPLPWTEQKVVDRNGVSHERNAKGELYLRGPSIFPGYYKRPEETAKVKTEDGWLKTGDEAVIHMDGSVTITGRLKRISIPHESGINVSCEEVEMVLQGHDAVEDAVVFNVGQKKDEMLVAVVVPKHADWNTEEMEKVLRDHCTTRLQPIKFPERYVFIDLKTLADLKALTNTSKMCWNVVRAWYEKNFSQKT